MSDVIEPLICPVHGETKFDDILVHGPSVTMFSTECGCSVCFETDKEDTWYPLKE